MRGLKGQYHCDACNKTFFARVADRARGWAKFCSKSCKQVFQEEKQKVWKVLSRASNQN